MSGIFTVSEKWAKEYKSNFEAGNGYADISLALFVKCVDKSP